MGGDAAAESDAAGLWVGHSGFYWSTAELYGLLERWGDGRFSLEQLKAAPIGFALYIASSRFTRVEQQDS